MATYWLLGAAWATGAFLAGSWLAAVKHADYELRCWHLERALGQFLQKYPLDPDKAPAQVAIERKDLETLLQVFHLRDFL